jgi:ATP-dependent helicase/DNAse subunit B
MVAVHVLCGPAASGKTQRLLERYQAAVRTGPLGAALWLGPTRRVVDALHRRLHANQAASLGLSLLTFQDFADKIVDANGPAARPLSHVQRRLLTDKVVADLHRRKRLSHFRGIIDTRGFSETVFALLAELKQHEIWPETFSEAVARTSPEDAAGRKVRQCALIYHEYQQLLIRHRLYDLEGRVWYARELLAHGQCRPFESVRALFLDGFTEFTPSQHEMLALLSRQVEELWLALPGESPDERGELFSRSRRTLERLQGLAPHVEYLHRPLPMGNGNVASVGLAHVERELFRPVKAVRRAADASGLACIEAPGLVGEARMVARAIKTLLLEGTAPDDILVTMRDLNPYADLLGEVLGEYGIPADIDGIEPLQQNPAVATLLRALRVPEHDWPFAQVTALLRSGYFRPDWPETLGGPEMAQHSEVLLRLLAEPRGRDATLTEVAYWAEHPRPGLEDEQAEASRRQRTHELARKCRGFLECFYRAWDSAPVRGRLADHIDWVRAFAQDLGINAAAADEPRDATALDRLWEELDEWVRVDRLLHKGRRLLDRAEFQRTLQALAAEAGLPRTPRGPGRVRVLPALLARGLRVPYVFMMGIGERSFPRLMAPHDFFDEQERQAFRDAGLGFPGVADRMPDEMLLFYQVVTAAERRLVLSYPAVDDKGQELLPSSFLTTIRECFEPKAIPTDSRSMLTGGLDTDVPLCPAEQRVRLARTVRGQRSDVRGQRSDVRGYNQVLAADFSPLPSDLLANLEAAAAMARQRFHAPEHGKYDGLLRDPRVVAHVGTLFGPGRILSPTALENYIACPFKFFLGNVLRLEPLEEPSEEIESTDRGLACHRALYRLHKHLRATGVDAPTDAASDELSMRLDEAVAECAGRTSAAGQALWTLEGRRLQRLAARYRTHWEKLIEPWLVHGVRPRPEHFEVSFGLPAADGEEAFGPLVIADGSGQVRISGRIDRVDVAELPDGTVGFWVIDYKTGRGTYYTGADLEEFRRLQLTLYALAVEQVLLTGKQARPLGLAYWLLMENGPKVALPGRKPHLSWFKEARAWDGIREALRSWVLQLVAAMRQGQFPLKPRKDDCTATCDFAQVCRINQSRSAVKDKKWQLLLPTIP